MKKIIAAALCSLALDGGAWADPIEGIWKTEVDDGAYGHIKMTPCGSAYCGTIHKSFNSSGEYVSANQGKKLVIDMKPKGGGKYAGKVWRPSNDKIYVAKVALSGNKLKLSGCVAGGLICSKQTWTRVK